MAQIYMKIEGIDGNVTASGHEKWIEISEFSFGVGRGITSANPGRQSNREGSAPSFSEISISKIMDETSPKIFTEACIGKAKKVEVHFCESGDKIQSYVEYIFSNVLMSGYSVNSSGGKGHPVENVSLNYSKLEMKYIPYNDKHEPGSPIPAGYDLVEGKKV